MKLETLETAAHFQVVRDLNFAIVGRLLDDEFLTKEELFDQVSHLCVVGDIWEVIEDNGGKWLQCITGNFEGEYNDGWFDADDMLNKGAFEIMD